MINTRIRSRHARAGAGGWGDHRPGCLVADRMHVRRGWARDFLSERGVCSAAMGRKRRLLGHGRRGRRCDFDVRRASETVAPIHHQDAISANRSRGSHCVSGWTRPWLTRAGPEPKVHIARPTSFPGLNGRCVRKRSRDNVGHTRGHCHAERGRTRAVRRSAPDERTCRDDQE